MHHIYTVETNLPLFKCLLLGDVGTGKTSFISRHIEAYFAKKYIDVFNAVIYPINFYTNKGNINFQVWDTVEHGYLGTIPPHIYDEAKCAIIMFDVTNLYTYKNVEKWYKEVTSKLGVVPIVVCGNKVDRADRRVFAKNVHIHKKYSNVKYCETSALNNYNVNLPFLLLAKVLLNNNNLKISEHRITDKSKQKLSCIRLKKIEGDLQKTEQKIQCALDVASKNIENQKKKVIKKTQTKTSKIEMKDKSIITIEAAMEYRLPDEWRFTPEVYEALKKCTNDIESNPAQHEDIKLVPLACSKPLRKISEDRMIIRLPPPDDPLTNLILRASGIAAAKRKAMGIDKQEHLNIKHKEDLLNRKENTKNLPSRLRKSKPSKNNNAEPQITQKIINKTVPQKVKIIIPSNNKQAKQVNTKVTPMKNNNLFNKNTTENKPTLPKTGKSVFQSHPYKEVTQPQELGKREVFFKYYVSPDPKKPLTSLERTIDIYHNLMLRNRNITSAKLAKQQKQDQRDEIFKRITSTQKKQLMPRIQNNISQHKTPQKINKIFNCKTTRKQTNVRQEKGLFTTSESIIKIDVFNKDLYDSLHTNSCNSDTQESDGESVVDLKSTVNKNVEKQIKKLKPKQNIEAKPKFKKKKPKRISKVKLESKLKKPDLKSELKTRKLEPKSTKPDQKTKAKPDLKKETTTKNRTTKLESKLMKPNEKIETKPDDLIKNSNISLLKKLKSKLPTRDQKPTTKSAKKPVTKLESKSIKLNQKPINETKLKSNKPDSKNITKQKIVEIEPKAVPIRKSNKPIKKIESETTESDDKQLPIKLNRKLNIKPQKEKIISKNIFQTDEKLVRKFNCIEDLHNRLSEKIENSLPNKAGVDDKSYKFLEQANKKSKKEDTFIRKKKNYLNEQSDKSNNNNKQPLNNHKVQTQKEPHIKRKSRANNLKKNQRNSQTSELELSHSCLAEYSDWLQKQLQKKISYVSVLKYNSRVTAYKTNESSTNTKFKAKAQPTTKGKRPQISNPFNSSRLEKKVCK